MRRNHNSGEPVMRVVDCIRNNYYLNTRYPVVINRAPFRTTGAAGPTGTALNTVSALIPGTVYRTIPNYQGPIYKVNINNPTGISGTSENFAHVIVTEPMETIAVVDSTCPTASGGAAELATPTGAIDPTVAVDSSKASRAIIPAAAVADATSTTDVMTQFNQLLANMRSAGLLSI